MSTTASEVTIPGRYFRDAITLANGETYDISAAETKTAAVEIHNIAFSGGCTVYLVAQDEDGTDTQTVEIDSFTGSGISQGNQIEITNGENVICRIENTSGGEANYIATGQQVSL